jgi:nucleotide-binding universal stress UspA family protein
VAGGMPAMPFIVLISRYVLIGNCKQEAMQVAALNENRVTQDRGHPSLDVSGESARGVLLCRILFLVDINRFNQFIQGVLMKILLAADGSEYTIKAIEYVTTHFDWFKDNPELHLFHVQSPIPEARARAALGDAAVENYYNEESKAALAPAETLFRKKGIPFKGKYMIGDVAEQIQAYVEKNKIDMIVMGSHGHGALMNLIMGSVATKVLAMTTVPVLLVR